jgi:hypothetical protein
MEGCRDRGQREEGTEGQRWRDGGTEGQRDGGMEGWRDGGTKERRDGEMKGQKGQRDEGTEGQRDRQVEEGAAKGLLSPMTKMEERRTGILKSVTNIIAINISSASVWRREHGEFL